MCVSVEYRGTQANYRKEVYKPLGIINFPCLHYIIDILKKLTLFLHSYVSIYPLLNKVKLRNASFFNLYTIDCST